jgi:hypothetical protein
MPISNYDTRPTPAPLFGSDHTERARHIRLWAASGAGLFGAGALAFTGWWVWIMLDRWLNGSAAADVSGTTLGWIGLTALVLWAVSVLLVRMSRRQ